MNTKLSKHSHAFILLSAFFISISFAANKKVKNPSYPKRNAFVINGIEIDAWPVQSGSFDSLRLHQQNLWKLKCYITEYGNSYSLRGSDKYGDVELALHSTKYYEYSSRYSNSRTNRDTVYVANVLLGRLIKAGVCSESSKGYTPNNQVEVEKPQEKPTKDDRYW